MDGHLHGIPLGLLVVPASCFDLCTEAQTVTGSSASGFSSQVD